MDDFAERLRNNRKRFDLTICILTLSNRADTFHDLYVELRRQAVGHSVQILWLGDNKSMKVGPKRNAILSLAEGVYVTFIDDDDEVAPDYIKEIMAAMNGMPDVITFHVAKYHNGTRHRTHKHILGHGKPHQNPRDRSEILMNPGHLCAWKRDIIVEAFPDKSLGEDHDWGERMAQHIQKVHAIDKELYYYYYDTNESETHYSR